MEGNQDSMVNHVSVTLRFEIYLLTRRSICYFGNKIKKCCANNF